jgi:dsRNA-specific ribonuclease
MFTKGRKERMEKVESRVRSLLGTVTDDQKSILKTNKDVFDQQIVTRAERRSKLHNDFKTILEQETSAQTKEKMLHDAFVAYQKESFSDSRSIAIAKTFMPTLNSVQKENIRIRLSELEEILNYFVETVY